MTCPRLFFREDRRPKHGPDYAFANERTGQANPD